MTIVAK